MDKLSTKALTTATAALVAGAAYVDGHYAIRRDVNQLLSDRKFAQRVQAKCQALSNQASMYGHMLLADR
jgi:predicted component of type VI protein secretion system